VDRKITSIATLAPAPNAWRAWIDTPLQPKGADPAIPSGRQIREAASLAELASALSSQTGPKNAPPEINLALPTRLLVLERLTLPSADRTELAGMVRLQLEKTLPYPVEETTSGFQVISQKETEIASPSSTEGGDVATAVQTMTESTVLICAVHNETLQSFCAPLLQSEQFPHSVTPWAMHVAAKALPGDIACALWQEETDVVFAIFENGVLGHVEILPASETFSNDLPQALMSAELAGADTAFTVALVDTALMQHADALEKALGVPVAELTLEEPPSSPRETPTDLTLQAWRTELARRQRMHAIQSRLGIAGVVYAVLMAIACIGLAMQNHRLHSVEAELAKVQPQVDAVLGQQNRWKELGPAIDPSRFTVEMLFQVFQSLPSTDVRITQFEQSPNEIRVEGEAPDAAQAVNLEEKLKAQPALTGYDFQAGNPQILSNDHAKFSISGKL